jgi:hypothetical protein
VMAKVWAFFDAAHGQHGVHWAVRYRGSDAVIAHGGGPEYAEHLELARRYLNVHVGTTMIGTDFSGPRTATGMNLPAGTVTLDGQLHRGVNGLDFVRRFRGSGPGIAVLTSSTKRRKPISADSNRADFALAA